MSVHWDTLTWPTTVPGPLTWREMCVAVRIWSEITTHYIALSISTARHVQTCPGPATFRYQNCAFTVRTWMLSNTRFRGPTWVHIPNSITIGSAALAGTPSWQTDRPTDRPHYSVQAGIKIGIGPAEHVGPPSLICDLSPSTQCWTFVL